MAIDFFGHPIKLIPNVEEFVPIALPNTDGQTNTRKVIKATLVHPNPVDSACPIKIRISHQKKNKSGTFEDTDHFNLVHVPVGHEVQIILDTQQTKALYEALKGIYQYCENELGIESGLPVFTLENIDKVVGVPEGLKKTVVNLIQAGNPQLWEELADLESEGLSRMSHLKVLKEREKSLELFKIHLSEKDWTEPEWQAFFEENTWIFGYGLNYRWISKVGDKFETTTTGSSITDSGKRPDGFAKVLAKISTTVFIDIKLPESPLLESTAYRRPDVYSPSKEISGAVSQILITINKWVAGRDFSAEILDREGFPTEQVYSFNPKGILIIGSLDQLRNESGSVSKYLLQSFELYRRSKTNPEIITYDELYERAKTILVNLTSNNSKGGDSNAT